MESFEYTRNIYDKIDNIRIIKFRKILNFKYKFY